jgi:hypothetical protein
MSRGVWNESFTTGDFFYCIGGTNTINPFSSDSIKNELVDSILVD